MMNNILATNLHASRKLILIALLNSNEPLRLMQICEALGYSDHSHLCRLIKLMIADGQLTVTIAEHIGSKRKLYSIPDSFMTDIINKKYCWEAL